jgi:hypothetical protein
MPDLHLDIDGEESVNAPAYQELQTILDHLSLAWDWPFARTVCTFTISGRSANLPSNFWRIGFQDPLYVLDESGARSRLVLQAPDKWHDMLGQPDSEGDAGLGRPERGWLRKDNGQGILYVDPIPDQTYTVEIHFYPWQCALTDPSDRPWFPYSHYLVSRLASVLALSQDDSRAQSEFQLAEKMMQEIRRSISDQDTRGRSIPLSRSTYRSPLRL